jgi:putative heme-binding domain-containing protein
LIDWYDKNACHRGSANIWDRTNGRVYKITYGSTKPVQVDLSKLTNAELVQLQLHRNDWYVRTARRLLQERAAAGDSSKAVVDRDVHRRLRNILDTHADVTRRLRALWALHVTGGLTDKLAGSLLDDGNLYVRAWTIQLLLENRKLSKGLAGKLASLSRTERSPVVRLYLASALQRLPLDDRWPIANGLLTHADDAGDHNLPLVIWYGIEPLVKRNPPEAIAMARRSRIPLITRYIVRRAAVDPQAVEHVLAALGKTDDENSQLMMLEEIKNVVKSRGRLKMPKSWPDVYAKLTKSKTAAIREHAQFITVKFGDKSIFPVLRGIVADNKAAVQSRRQALDALLDGRDPDLPALMHRLLDDRTLRGPVLRGLARFDDPATPRQILSRYKSFNQEQRSDAVISLASRKSYAMALLDAMGQGQVPRKDLSAFTVGQLQRFGDKQLLAKLNRVWGQIRSTSADKLTLIAKYKQTLTAKVLAAADLPHGRALYKETCAKCHRLFGDGGKIGPDITGSNRGNLTYIFENILDPSAVVGRDYLITVVVTTDGRVLTGLITQENESALTLQTVNEQIVVPLADIESRKKSTKSIMPEGQLDKMKSSDVRDLIAYLASPSQVPLPGEGPLLDPQTGRVAGAFEGETIKILAKTGGDARSQKMNTFAKAKWSGADQLWWTGAKPGDKLTLELPVRTAGRYELFTVMTKARDYGIVQWSLDGKKIGPRQDLYNPADVVTTGVVSLGTLELKAGKHRLTAEIVGAHPQAIKAYMFGLDYVYLAAVRERVGVR